METSKTKTPARTAKGRKKPAIQTRIKQIRKEHHMTQQEMADLLGLSRQYYTCLEKGMYDLTVDKLQTLNQEFGVTADYVLGFDKGGKVQVSEEELELIKVLHKLDNPKLVTSLLNLVKGLFISYGKDENGVPVKGRDVL